MDKVKVAKLLADIATIGAKDKSVILNADDVNALNEAAVFLIDSTRQAAPPEDNAQFWRDHCRDLLQHDMMRQSLECGDKANHYMVEKIISATTLLSSADARGACPELTKAAQRFLTERFAPNELEKSVDKIITS